MNENRGTQKSLKIYWNYERYKKKLCPIKFFIEIKIQIGWFVGHTHVIDQIINHLKYLDLETKYMLFL